MTRLVKVAMWCAVVGAAIPVVSHLFYLAVPNTPNLWIFDLVLSPPSVLFIATAACSPLDACSMKTLAAVVVLNAVLYALVGSFLYVVLQPLRRWAGKT